MKKILTILIFTLYAFAANAQFTSAVLQASGLTCAMCTRAINNSLGKLSFIQSIDPDIQNSAFNITFKNGQAVDIDQLKKAVEDAGFSVAKLRLTGNFNNVPVKNDAHIVINGSNFHFLKVDGQVLNGKKEITIVDRNFLTAREFKKYSGATQMSCIQTGRANTCCKQEGITGNTRIYHATI